MLTEQTRVVRACLFVHQVRFSRSFDRLHDSTCLPPLKIFTSSCGWLINDNNNFFLDCEHSLSSPSVRHPYPNAKRNENDPEARSSSEESWKKNLAGDIATKYCTTHQ